MRTAYLAAKFIYFVIAIAICAFGYWGGLFVRRMTGNSTIFEIFCEISDNIGRDIRATIGKRF